MAKYWEAPEFLITDLEESLKDAVSLNARKRGISEKQYWNDLFKLAESVGLNVLRNKKHPEKSIVTLNKRNRK